MTRQSEELSIDAQELLLWIENTEPLYQQQLAIVANLKKHILKGQYRPARAVKAWRHLTNAGSDSYKREFGHRFTVAIRRELAAYLEPVERFTLLETDDYNTDATETARLRRAYRLSRRHLRPCIRQLAEEERAADRAADDLENLRQMGTDTGYESVYAAEWDRLDRIYCDARNQATDTEFRICEICGFDAIDYGRFRALVDRHYNAA